MQTFCVRFDPNDKYIAAGKSRVALTEYVGCGDGSIRIFNVFTGKQSYILNNSMDEPMPTTNIKYMIECC
jgi:WD40 repeat protein